MARAPALEVIADHREMASGVPAALEALGVSVRTATLHAGDYAIGNELRAVRGIGPRRAQAIYEAFKQLF